MKRENNLIEQIADPDNLRLAFWKARKAKDGKMEVAEYRKNLDKNLLLLRDNLLTGNVDVGNYYYFTIYDPKERKICAAAFHERVLHHAIMNVCHANFEKFQVYSSFASRLGKGTYAAIEKAKAYQQQFKWFLKLDVRKYFDSFKLKSEEWNQKEFQNHVLPLIAFVNHADTFGLRHKTIEMMKTG